MALKELQEALAMFKAFADSLPKGDIEEKYVDLYHKTLNDIAAQIHLDLSYFRIPENELNKRLAMTYDNEYGERESLYTDERYCDRDRFLMSLRGAVNFINARTQASGDSTLINPPK